MRFVFVVLGLALIAAPHLTVAEQGTPDPSSGDELNDNDPLDRTTPTWFADAKLGIIIHWNAASIPAFAPVTSIEALLADHRRSGNDDFAGIYRKLPYAEMYQTAMAVPGSATARYHAKYYGDMPYDGFVARFRDEMIPGWDPEEWATLFARAGARYVVLTSKTEDGFLLWPSEHANPHKENWQSKRDVVGELATAVRAEGMRFGIYYSGGSDWTFGGLEPGSERPRSERYRSYVDSHWRELIQRYEPNVMWNDYSYPGSSLPFDSQGTAELDPEIRRHIEDLLRFYVTRVPDGVINNRFDMASQSAGDLYADFVTPEYSTDPEAARTGRAEGLSLKWEVVRGIGTSFGYNALEDENSYMSSAELIHMFVDIVARGGNLLLNVGPMATGDIPWIQAQRILELGWFLRTNGDAIYGTHPWIRQGGITGAGLEVRYTESTDAVFAILLGVPEGGLVELDLRLEDGVEVSIEGRPGPLKWMPTPAGVRVDLLMLPDDRPAMSLRFSPAAGVHPL
jgi:alpha-L-fucosidase